MQITQAHPNRQQEGNFPFSEKLPDRPTREGSIMKKALLYLWEGPEQLQRALRMEWRFVAMRWLGMILIIPGLMLFEIPRNQIYGVYGLLLVAMAYNLSLQIMLARSLSFLSRGYVTTICDGLLNIAMVVIAGGFDTPFYFIVHTVTISAAMRYGYGPVMATASLYVAADVAEGLILRDGLDGAFFMRSAFLMLTALIAAYLHEQAQDAQAALEERLHQANALNKELEAFSYSVSHDLRAPLRSIDGFSQALLEDYSEEIDEIGQDYLARVRAASQRMAQLIDDLLNLSRVTRSEMHRESVNLSWLALDITAELQASFPDRQVNIEIQPDIIANVDERLLRVVLENLLGNAWKFTSKKTNGKIEFGVMQQNTTTYFVRDNGVGFEMEYANKLFGAFQRLHSMNEFEGNGIGLATVARIIHRHGGQVWAKGVVGEGATFYFTL